MSRAQKMFNKPQAKPILPDKKNFDGFPAYSVSIYEQYIQMLMVNTIGNTYYISGNELFTYSVALHEKMRDEDPAFMARAAVYARNFGFMRMQPIVACAYLSTVPNKAFFHGAFPKVIKTPGDLMDFVSVIGSIRKGKGLGRTVKRAINNWLTGVGYEYRKEGLSQYHAIKYGGGKSGEKWTLKDIIKLSRPHPENNMQTTLFNYIVNGTVSDNLEQVAAVEALKRTAMQKKELSSSEFSSRVISLIDAGRLPYEVVTGIIKPDTTIWEHLMKQMPIFALVRHLNTLEEAGVFNKKENVDYVAGQLTNTDIITRSRMLPFRFSTAFKNFKGNVTVANALKRALDISLSNIEMLPGRNAFFLDVSGSMSGEYLEIGSLLGIAAAKKSNDAIFLCFSSELKYPRIDVNDTVMTNMDACRKVFGGGTETNLTIDHLLGTVKASQGRMSLFGGGYSSDFPVSERKSAPTKVDNIVIITDEQQNSGSPVIGRFREYRKKVNPSAKLFIIDVAPYNARLANQDEPGVTFIYGWNDTVLDILKYAMEGSGHYIEQIKNMRI